MVVSAVKAGFCAICGAEIAPHPHAGRPRKYCTECSDERGRVRGRDRSRVSADCVECGVRLETEACTERPRCRDCRESS
jgi:hypothetical protein